MEENWAGDTNVVVFSTWGAHEVMKLDENIEKE